MLNIRSATRRVNRWQVGTDQAHRWLAVGLTEAEQGFRRIDNSFDLESLEASLRNGAYLKNLKKHYKLLNREFRKLAVATLWASPSTSRQQALTP